MRRSGFNIGGVVLVVALLTGPVHALTLPAIFGDHMVLQQGKPIPVWGAAEPAVRIQVTFAGQTKIATADAEGKWRIALDPLLASAEPRVLTVTAAGSESAVSLRDVLVGEVWLCSGQSNMFWPVGKIANARSSWPGVLNGEKEVANANWPAIRFNCADDHEFGLGGWRACTPENTRGFSATAYFFGLELHRVLGVPIGLINRSIGGTSLQAWTPREELEALPIVRRYEQILETERPRIQAWTRAFAAFRAAVRAGAAPRPARPAALPDELETARKLHSRGTLHERYIAPLVPFALRGQTWYQGESNTAPAALAAAYGDMMDTLIAGRRRLWSDPELPFYFVQLPIFSKAVDQHWHLVREGMRRVQARTPHTGMAVTYDFSDPTLLHPPEKQEVGRRLALWALARDYGRAVAYSGPLYQSIRYEGGQAVVVFAHARGLRTGDGLPPRGFELAGADGRFHPALARIEGERIVLHAPEVPAPCAARFFWGGLEAPNIINAAGLPASPFATGPRVPTGPVKPALSGGRSGATSFPKTS